MATLTRDEAAKRFDELPLPTTADEHWRFTDLRGFSVPEEVSDTAVSGTCSGSAAATAGSGVEASTSSPCSPIHAMV